MLGSPDEKTETTMDRSSPNVLRHRSSVPRALRIAVGMAGLAAGVALASTAAAQGAPASAAAPSTSVDTVHFTLIPNPKFAPCLAAYPSDTPRAPIVKVTVIRAALNDTLIP